MEHHLYTRDEFLDHRFADLESHCIKPIDPNVVQRISALEAVYVDHEAIVYKRLLALESICIDHIADERDARVTALETNVTNVNAWLTEQDPMGSLLDRLLGGFLGQPKVCLKTRNKVA